MRSSSPDQRRASLEKMLSIDLSALSIDPKQLGDADQKNCEQMFGHVPIPVGYAGPLPITFSSGESVDIHLPLATTEGALVASVNRGCKALREAGGVKVESVYHGVTRSLAFKLKNNKQQPCQKIIDAIHQMQHEWKMVGESTSNHLKILKYDIDIEAPYLFLTIYADTDRAMGMNMVTIAAQKIGEWIQKNLNLEFITVAGNVDSDKKPSKRTHDRGRGYEVTASATISADVISNILKTTPDTMVEVANAKLDAGSRIAGALGSNLHAANIIAALYLATGQDAAHVVEGSMADTECKMKNEKCKITIRIPAILVGTVGGGTELPAQQQCLNILLQSKTSHLKPTQQLAESIGAAVLAGELSLLAALSSHHLAQSHKTLAR
ncbi:3-hydroxy-3-methylglutaryl-CoA reductase [Candidatus Peregrinibacteria bacterium]|nr:3-hydroxy-3-methylglutaryl-CoA reductase [Candidatus Peregrinibacteria bacterium]